MFLLSGLQESIGVHDKFYWRLFRRPGTRIAFLRAQKKHGLLFQTSWQQQTVFPDFKFLPHGNCTGSKFQPDTLPRGFFFFSLPFKEIITSYFNKGHEIISELPHERSMFWRTRSQATCLLFQCKNNLIVCPEYPWTTPGLQNAGRRGSNCAWDILRQATSSNWLEALAESKICLGCIYSL